MHCFRVNFFFISLICLQLFHHFIPQFAELVRSCSPVASGVADPDRLAAEVPRQIANAHTLFNITATLLFLGFTNTLATVVERIVPRARPAPAGAGAPRHLDRMFLEQPSVALDQVKLELAHMGELVTVNAGHALALALAGDEASLRALEASDEDIDHLHGEILAYAGRIAERDLVEPQTRRLQRYIGVANYLENMGDVVETGFVPVGLKRLQSGRPMDEDVRDWLLPLHDLALAVIGDALAAFAEDDPLRAQAVRESKADFNRKCDALRLLPEPGAAPHWQTHLLDAAPDASGQVQSASGTVTAAHVCAMLDVLTEPGSRLSGWIAPGTVLPDTLRRSAFFDLLPI